MTRRWYHEVSEEWMRRRHDVLTATDIVRLYPEYKRYLKLDPGTLMPGFAALWAEKMTDADVDTVSIGDAARGHIFEPYAVEAWNAQVKHQMYHWDDVVICNNGVGFSPDAMDVERKGQRARFDVDGMMLVDQDGVMQDAPAAVLEIKSYAPAHHMKCCMTPKLEQAEMLQVAVPFVVLPNLVQACLVFFCPGAPVSMKAFAYTRKDLEKQIEIVEGMAKLFEETAVECTEFANANGQLDAMCTVDEIWTNYLSQQEAESGGFVLRR
jgi:hypothetical protein